MTFDLPVILSFIVAIGVVIYVLLDGFDLGVGILFPYTQGTQNRRLMLNSIAPVWDGNETWLVLGGAVLLGAFPYAYATILPAYYLSLMILIFALIFRGIAFEFRFKATRNQLLWDGIFAFGSTVATFMQGCILGWFLMGANPLMQKYITILGYTICRWADIFAVMCGLGLLTGYGLLGATWLIIKSVDKLQDHFFQVARRLVPALLFFIGIVSLATPVADSEIARRWFSWPNIAWLSPVPLLTAFVSFKLWQSLARRQELAPFIYTYALFLLSFLGLGISIFPYVIPRSMTIWQASSHHDAQLFILVGLLALLPVILGYTIYTYWVFRGKASAKSSY